MNKEKTVFFKATYFYILKKPNIRGFFFFLKTSLLEYDCFTMVCQFLLYNKVNQLYVYIYPHISSLLCLSPTLPIPPLQVVTKYRIQISLKFGIFLTFMFITLLLSSECEFNNSKTIQKRPVRFQMEVFEKMLFSEYL